jgi:crossover junction endodeoxyribonuclease RusA
VTAPLLLPAGIVRPRSWRVELPPKTLLLNANDSMHWRKKADIVTSLRNVGRAMARAHRLPSLERAHVLYVIHPDTMKRNRTVQGKQRRDPGNWAPTAKAVIDGFVDYGVLPDDNSERLLGPDPRIGEPVSGSQIVFYITDLDAMDPAHIALLNPPGDQT